MNNEKQIIEVLKIIRHYTDLKGEIGLSVLERKVFDLIGFEEALNKNFRLTELTKNLVQEGYISQTGLAVSVTEKGRELLRVKTSD